MPSELVWVALISSGVGAVAALGGAGLSGLITYKITARQSDSLADQSKKQIKHQEREARRDRTVEARTANLIVVRDTLSRLIGAYFSFSGRIVNIRQLNEEGIPPDDPGRQLIMTQMEESSRIWIEEVNGLEGVLATLSDNELIKLIEEFNKGLGEITTGDAPINFDDLAEKMTEVRDRLAEYRFRLVPINRRIEELLSGDDLK